VSGLVKTYRGLAFVVGVVLLFCCVTSVLKYLHTWFGIMTGPLAEGGSLQHFGEQLAIAWMVHGYLFIVYVVVAFFLSRKARWSMVFTITALVAGTIPVMIFFVEHKVMEKLRSENPELAGVAHSQA
jgi:integral membrane protein